MTLPSFPHKGCFADSSSPVTISPGCDMTIQQLVAVARGDGQGNYSKVLLGGNWKTRCQKSADYVRRAVDETMNKSRDQLAKLALATRPNLKGLDQDNLAQRALIYGVTTGFGTFKSRSLDSIEAASQMQINILRSHATGVGPPMPVEVVRAMMLIRLRTFIEGHSGIRPDVINLLLDLLNEQVHPHVPEQGSVGSSGDLCPLSHLSLVLIGEGKVLIDGKPCPTIDALRQKGLDSRVFKTLAPKEGIALTNGTSAATAYAALAVHDASVLYGTANLNVSLTLQALCGATRALDPKVHKARRHSHQAEAANQILTHITGSTLANRSNDVQDAYSVRCAPAVHGAALRAIDHAWLTIELEINGVTDNPLIFDGVSDGPPCDDYAGCIWDFYAAGNFHGEPVGLVCDYLKIAVAELANISERRVQALLDEHHSRGLPANLWPDPATAGMNSGLMIAQYTAAALVSENKTLAHPASVDSIPTSANVEDHVAMSTIAARHARRVVDNARNVLAIELLAAIQALDLRLAELKEAPEKALSHVAKAVHALIRKGDVTSPAVPALTGQDREIAPDIATLAQLIASARLLSVVNS